MLTAVSRREASAMRRSCPLFRYTMAWYRLTPACSECRETSLGVELGEVEHAVIPGYCQVSQLERYHSTLCIL
jgi:hypothetical protein